MATHLGAVALELCITWVNRILFLKLLEAQLFQYHGANKEYLFLNSALIFDYDELANLFFQVLAEKAERRRPQLQQKFAHVPYLNSSLFERTALERATLDISALDNRQLLPLHKDTVLKEANGKRRTGSLPALDYLFQFLDAYDFTSEGKAEIQEENKTLINASVLGLIFEKINGYKDGSFFTPGFITMYMCRETLRRAVVQKFNEAKGWNVEHYEDLYDKIDNRTEANAIINSLTICDPAVGSGHFLVSALNELIAIKADLKILQDRAGKRLKEYSIEVVNDELVVTDEDGEAVDYKPGHPESQRVQEALFHEKENLIESCLFGVDINANSVKICRLRLWIELLKHAYYTKESGYKNLETLPNIDINIKQGNSLISRYALDADVTPALKQSKWTIDTYRTAVHSYKEAQTKEEKRELESLIATIKGDFRKDVSPNDPIRKKLSAKRGELAKLTQTKELFGGDNKPKKAALKAVEKLSGDIEKLEAELKEAENNKIYTDAFEWRFEFPEVLDNEGKFIGFDVVIGNPPYISIQDLKENNRAIVDYYKAHYTSAQFGNFDIYIPFLEHSDFITHGNSQMCFIIPSKFFTTDYGALIRKYMISKNLLSDVIDFGHNIVFDGVSVYTCIISLSKQKKETLNFTKTEPKKVLGNLFKYPMHFDQMESNTWSFASDETGVILQRSYEGSVNLINVPCAISRGSSTGDDKLFVLRLSEKGLVNGYGDLVSFEDKIILKPIYATDYTRYLFKGAHTNFLIFPYKLNEKQEYKTFDEQELKEVYPLTYKYFSDNKDKLAKRKQFSRWFGYSAARNLKLHEDADIIIPLLADRGLFALFPKDHGYTLMAGGGFSISILNKDIDRRYPLAILNSKLIFFILYRQSNKFRGGYITCTKQYVENLPIKLVDNNRQDPFITLVNQILTAKQQNPSADTTFLEKQIDDLVYQLYGLTEEEIAIVEKGQQ